MCVCVCVWKSTCSVGEAATNLLVGGMVLCGGAGEGVGARQVQVSACARTCETKELKEAQGVTLKTSGRSTCVCYTHTTHTPTHPHTHLEDEREEEVCVLSQLLPECAVFLVGALKAVCVCLCV